MKVLAMGGQPGIMCSYAESCNLVSGAQRDQVIMSCGLLTSVWKMQFPAIAE